MAEARLPVSPGDWPCVAPEFGGAENQRRRHLNRRFENQIMRRRQIHRLQGFSHALGKCVVAEQKNRDIRPQRQPDLLQTLTRYPGLPEMIEREQHRGRIGTAAAQSAAHRQPFFQMDVDALPTPGFGLQKTRCPQTQIRFRRHTRQRGGKAQFGILTRGKTQAVTDIDQAEKRLQQMVAIAATSGDVQEKIELGRCRISAVPVPAGRIGLRACHGERSESLLRFVAGLCRFYDASAFDPNASLGDTGTLLNPYLIGFSMEITTLGEARFPSPIAHHYVSDALRVPYNAIIDPAPATRENFLFEVAGPREKLFFDPKKTRAAVVTCGGLCPGLNNVIRSLVRELHHSYGVCEILGFVDGYQGLDPWRGKEPIPLTLDFVEEIHKAGGSAINTSRGPVDISVAVDNLIRRKIDILFVVGGDGTQRGGAELFQEASRRGHALAVVGIPKTIDNDIPFVSRTFGYLTAIEEAVKAITCAHTEAHSVHNGISLVKIMGRHAGFIAAGATVASQDVNFALVPEVPFKLDGADGFLAALKARVQRRAHAVILVAEGAGQHLMHEANDENQFDASGNLKFKDIGPFLRDRIVAYLNTENVPHVMRYIDPSYLIRSVPASAEDAILCDFYARNAVHAAMAGKTGLVIGQQHDIFIHIPIGMLAEHKKQLSLSSTIWRGVIACTGQNFASVS